MTKELRKCCESLMVKDSDISKSSFDDVNLRQTVFNNVNLSEVSFTDVNFSNASIADANLTGMTINGILVSALLQAYQNRAS